MAVATAAGTARVQPIVWAKGIRSIVNRTEYLETQDGQDSRRRARFQRRQRFVIENHEPRSKNSISSAEEIAFQQSITAQLAKAGRRAFQSKVILEIDFFSRQADPPAVHTLAKNYMDLLQKPVKGSGITREQLVLADDRLIDVLIVNYRVREDDEPRVELNVGTMADFVDDLRLLKRIRASDFNDDVRYDPDVVWGGRSFEGARDSLRDELENLRAWQRRQEEIETRFSAAAFLAMQRMMVMRVQELFLAAHEPKVDDLLFLLAHLIDPQAGASKSPQEVMRNLIVSPPMMLDLTHAPIPGAGKDVFKVNVTKALLDFKAQYELLFPLLVTVGVTVLCVPPAAQSAAGNETYVDLDNLARYVIPAIHRELKPPADTVHTIDVAAISDLRLRESFERRLAKLKRTPKESVTQYQVLRLPRVPTDPPEGFIRLALSAGGPYDGLWRRADEIIFRWQRER